MRSLLKTLRAKEILRNPRIEAAMLQVDRANYCQSGDPYEDSPAPIGYGATISAPHMHAYALELCVDRLVDGSRVLDIGSGSGYLTACLAHMVGPKGVVYGLDHIQELVEQSRHNIQRDCPELLTSGRIVLTACDGRDGLPDKAPFDVIHVGAVAPNLPDKLVSQLRVGGIMVIPIAYGSKQMFEKIEKLQDGSIERNSLFGVRYVPLTDVKSQLNS